MEITNTTSANRRSYGRKIASRLVSYIIVCAFLAFVNWMTTPGQWWVMWVMAGWGLGILLPAFKYLIGLDEEDDRR